MMEATSFTDTLVSDAGIDHSKKIERTGSGFVQEAKLYGKNQALDGRPSLQDTDISVHVEPIQSKFNLLIVDNREFIELNLAKFKSVMYDAKLTIAGLLKRKNEIEILEKPKPETEGTEAEPVTVPSTKAGYLQTILGGVMLLAIYIGEWFLLMKSFQVIERNKFFSFLFALSFSVALTAVLHLLKKPVQKIQSLLIRRIMIGGEILLVAAAVFALTYLRATFFGKTGSSAVPSWLFFALTAFFTLSVFLVLEYMIIAGIKKIQQARAYSKKEDAPAVTAWEELVEIKKEIARLSKERDTAEGMIAEFEMLAKATEIKIVRMYMAAISTYKAENIATRNAVPDGFRQMKYPPLFFYYISKDDLTNE